eukprot:PhM_4_TR6613/c0_g1_i1/m.49284
MYTPARTPLRSNALGDIANNNNSSASFSVGDQHTPSLMLKGTPKLTPLAARSLNHDNNNAPTTTKKLALGHTQQKPQQLSAVRPATTTSMATVSRTTTTTSSKSVPPIESFGPSDECRADGLFGGSVVLNVDCDSLARECDVNVPSPVMPVVPDMDWDDLVW